jgi:hypothetical protein
LSRQNRSDFCPDCHIPHRGIAIFFRSSPFKKITDQLTVTRRAAAPDAEAIFLDERIKPFEIAYSTHGATAVPLHRSVARNARFQYGYICHIFGLNRRLQSVVSRGEMVSFCPAEAWAGARG